LRWEEKKIEVRDGKTRKRVKRNEDNILNKYLTKSRKTELWDGKTKVLRLRKEKSVKNILS